MDGGLKDTTIRQWWQKVDISSLSPLIFNDLRLNRLFIIFQTHMVYVGLLSLVKFPFTRMTPHYYCGEQFSRGQWKPRKWVISLKLTYSMG